MNVSLFKPIYRAWRSYRDYGGDEALCRLLHRCRILSVNHAFNLFYGEFHPLLGVGVK